MYTFSRSMVFRHIKEIIISDCRKLVQKVDNSGEVNFSQLKRTVSLLKFLNTNGVPSKVFVKFVFIMAILKPEQQKLKIKKINLWEKFFPILYEIPSYITDIEIFVKTSDFTCDLSHNF
ncbi:hypothetical protein BpHYR1_026645 [Brachionus plicatilis]|uniref:Uncharacterized protein n=1 Tax=Brachionus plicatilis TaxID=10195 RepID=A0A3M7RMH1_BRAPC|nr:hypothetical protein BpHYR1_026645 [Brachionus plicatilis]